MITEFFIEKWTWSIKYVRKKISDFKTFYVILQMKVIFYILLTIILEIFPWKGYFKWTIWKTPHFKTAVLCLGLMKFVVYRFFARVTASAEMKLPNKFICIILILFLLSVKFSDNSRSFGWYTLEYNIWFLIRL